MTSRVATLRGRNPLPEGTVAVGAGLAVTGVASYGYLVISARVLGPAQAGSLSVLWALVFMIGGMFLPFEQEVSRRLVGRRVAGLGGRSIVRRAFVLGAVLVGVLVAAIAVAAPALTDRLFNGQGLLVVGLMLGAAGYLVANWTEGVLSGSGRFARYGAYLGGESLVRVSIAVGLLVAGVRTAGPIGLALGLAPLLVALPALWWKRDHGLAEPEVAWRELAAGLGALLAAALLAQALINASPVVLQLLAGPDQVAEVGIFTAALVVARIPLFLFQALQAVLLPALAALAVAGRFDEFRAGVRRMVVVVVGLGSTGIVVALAVGPEVILRVFGSKFPVDRRTVGMLAAASACYMVATTLAQALIALGEATQVALGWGTGVAAMALVVVLGNDPLFTVELAFLVATGVATVSMMLILRRALRRGATMTTESVLEAINDIPFET
jgi:O-antigen/teichoic acid export membrane protein